MPVYLILEISACPKQTIFNQLHFHRSKSLRGEEFFLLARLAVSFFNACTQVTSNSTNLNRPFSCRVAFPEKEYFLVEFSGHFLATEMFAFV